MKRHCHLSPSRDSGVTENRSSETEPGTSGVNRRRHSGADEEQEVTQSLGEGEIPGGKLTDRDAAGSVHSPELTLMEGSGGTEGGVTGHEQGEKDAVPGGSTSRPSEGSGMQGKKMERERDDFEDSLICAICQEILHDCIRLACRLVSLSSYLD